MCGIAGIWQAQNSSSDKLQSVVRSMTDAIRHRGPDASGQWIDEKNGLGLGHRRLSIIDLSPNGAQPAISDCERYILIFNGEIYNHQDIRRQLEAEGNVIQWKGHSDTQTLINAIAIWGLAATLEKSYGMFTIALWDRKEQALFLARDRMGEKPLYYGHCAGSFVFASELKAIATIPGFDAEVDPRALESFLRYCYIPEGQSIYRGITKLLPGTYLRLTNPTEQPETTSYWFLRTVALQGIASRDLETRSEEEYAQEMEEILTDAISSQMLSDVPLGSFLSGGIDSSLVTALMQKASRQKVRTFAIGFQEARYNEAEHAAAIAHHLGTDHTEFTVAERDALDVIPDLPRIYDEPFADPSQIPTTLLCRLARSQVTVALTGDGGDEVFGGYNRYLYAPDLWDRMQMIPPFLRKRVSSLFALIGHMSVADDSMISKLTKWMKLPNAVTDKLVKISIALDRSADYHDLFESLITTFHDPETYLISKELPGISQPPHRRHEQALSRVEWMMLMDSLEYLPGDILVKVDRAAMSTSLETRCPYLDGRVIEYAWRLPQAMRVHGRTGKPVLRQILDRHIPRSLYERPKQGFAIPLDRWLRSNLREWAEGLLAPEALHDAGILSHGPIRTLWDEHQSGRRNHGARLWNVLMLCAWFNDVRSGGRQ